MRRSSVLLLLLTYAIGACALLLRFNPNQFVGRRALCCTPKGNENGAIATKRVEPSRMVKSIMAIAASLLILGSEVLPAVAASIEDVNSKLSSYGLSPILYVPSGFAPVVSEFGRGNLKNEVPIVVLFAHPKNWVVQTTSVNGNGESGTISANDYFKGDSAFLFVDTTPIPSNVKDQILSVRSKDVIQAFITKALSQKGDPIESLQILSIQEGSQKTADGQPYVDVEFSYQLNTEAGFLVERHAMLSLTSVSNNIGAVKSRGEGSSVKQSDTEGSAQVPTQTDKKGVQLQGLVAVTTGKRWRGGMDSQLKLVVQSFRVSRLNSGVFSYAGAAAE